MDGALKVMLLAALILLVTAQTNYRSLPDVYREHIDKALKKANSNFGRGHHVAFHSLIGDPKIKEGTLNVKVLLMVTTCEKTSSDAYEHRDECDKQQQNRPMINCLVCKTKDKELVDCARRNDVKNWDAIQKTCENKYRHGGTILLRKSGFDETEIGCLGCM